MRLYMKPYAHGTGTLAGSIEGQKAFADLVRKTPVSKLPKSEVCLIDFSEIDVATSSFLRESLIAYRNHIRSHWTNLYPVAANLSPAVQEELEGYLVIRGDVFVTCSLNQSDQVQDVELIGQMDGKQLAALQAVIEKGETDAPELAREIGERVAPTAWNNRLGALAEKGVLISTTSGRNKRYRLVLEGLSYGA